MEGPSSEEEEEFYSADSLSEPEEVGIVDTSFGLEGSVSGSGLEVDKMEDRVQQLSISIPDRKGPEMEASTKSSSPSEERTKEEEVEFVVKNLDTGESFSSKEIEKYIPKGLDPKTLDPISFNILGRSQTKTGAEAEEPLSKRNQWLKKIKDAPLKVKKKATEKKSKKLFAQVSRQHLDAHKGAVWVMKFSYDGTLLATGGGDGIVKIWKVEESRTFLDPQPFRQLIGHSGDILELSWSSSRSNLLLSCSIDKTVRKWEVNTSGDCKHVFQHDDVVTAVVVHPKNEEQFVTGCLDNKLRIWNIRDGTVICSAVVDCGFVTAVALTLDGDTCVTGSYDGTCTFIKTEGLQFKMQKSVKNLISKGKKITGIQMMPKSRFALITSNDSRVRLYNMADHTVVWTYKGFKNECFQIYASFSEPKGHYILCGSEDHNVYMWPNDGLHSASGKTSRVHDSFQAHSSVVTAAIFAPFDKRKTSMSEGQIIVTADVTGELKVFENKLLTDGRATIGGQSKGRSILHLKRHSVST